MLRIIMEGNSQPGSFIVDPSATFQSGQAAEFTTVGNQVVVTVSNGICPFGIIDDVRTNAFTNVSWNEVIIVPAAGVMGPGGVLVTPVDLKSELRRPNVVASSFVSDVAVELNPINGVITFLAGTPLNFDVMGSGTPSAIRAVVNYTYQVANIPGDDSVIGSKRITVWWQRMFCQVSTFETNQNYPLRANLYVSEMGLFTTRCPSPKHPAVAIVTAPPTPLNPMLELLFL